MSLSSKTLFLACQLQQHPWFLKGLQQGAAEFNQSYIKTTAVNPELLELLEEAAEEAEAASPSSLDTNEAFDRFTTYSPPYFDDEFPSSSTRKGDPKSQSESRPQSSGAKPNSGGRPLSGSRPLSFSRPDPRQFNSAPQAAMPLLASPDACTWI